MDFTGVTVHSIKVRPGDAARVWVAEARISIPETRSYFDDGTYRNDNDARRNVRFAVTMRLDGKRYSLLAFSLG